MGQSLVVNYIHIVFSTKYRQKLIFPPYEEELHKYIGGVCNALECPVIIVGGYNDHIHILCRMTQKIPLMTLVQKVKANSSKWFKTKHKNLSNFYWQDGYGAFSVNPKQVHIVKRYIENQHKHHKTENYQNEMCQFFKEYAIDYDERYVWE